MTCSGEQRPDLIIQEIPRIQEPLSAHQHKSGEKIFLRKLHIIKMSYRVILCYVLNKTLIVRQRT